jgi:hypothetical protein
MNTISKIHQAFSRRLNNPRVLTNPEEFLGENFEAVLNFWLILDGLSEEQLNNILVTYNFFHDQYWDVWDKITDNVFILSSETIGEVYTQEIGEAAYYFFNDYDLCFPEWATRELIAMHKILEVHQQLLTFFPMFLEVL